MVQNLVSEGLLRSEHVIRSLKKVPREMFLPDNLKAFAYNDTPLPTGHGQTISAPHGESRTSHGSYHERGPRAIIRPQSAGGWSGQRLSRSHNRRNRRSNRT